MSVAQLVDHFRDIALAQYEAIEEEKHSTYNKLFDRMLDVDNELRAAGTTRGTPSSHCSDILIRRFA